MAQSVLFICTGNYYRSRYAEIYFNHLVSKTSLDWQAFSRGLEATMGYNEGPISVFTLKRLNQQGILLSEPIRYPMQLEEKDLLEAGQIIAINYVEHQPMMKRLFPAWANQITYWEIADLNITKADEALSAIETKVEELASSLVRHHNQ